MRAKPLARAVIVYLMSANAIPCQGKDLTFRDVIQLQAPASVTISDDGRRVAYTLREVDWKQSRFRSHIWVLDAATKEARQFTFGENSESSPKFSPDGRWLAFLSSRKGDSVESEESSGRQVWLIPVDGGEARTLTSAKQGVQGFSWRSDGSRIFYTTNETLDEGEVARRKKRQEQRFDETEYLKTQYKAEIWSVDLETRKAEMIYAGMKGLSSVQASPDGRRFAFTSNQTGLRKDSPMIDIWVFDLVRGQVRQLTTRHGAERGPTWSPDGRSILFSAPQDPYTSYAQTEYFILPAGGGTPQNLTADLDRSPNWVAFVSGGSELLLSIQNGTYTQLLGMDRKSRALRSIVSGDITIGNLSYAKGSRQFVFTKQTHNTLPEIYLSSLTDGNPVKMTDFSKQVRGYQLGRQEVISWTSKDGLSIEGILNYPVGYRPGDRVPLIVNPHGGPHGHYRDTFQGEYQVWANRGYATLSPNFRGSSGYGADFDVANKKDLGFGDYEDVLSGVDKVIEMGVADPDRMGVHGGSYGGFMTNWIITHTDRFRAAVSKYGIWHLLTDFSNSYSPRWEYNYFEVAYWDDWELWKKHSPGSYSKNVTTPVLILHGDADPNTVLSNSREMFTALWLQDKTVEFVTYPREGHGISKEPNHILDRQERVLSWWDKYLLQAQDAQVGDTVTRGDWKMKVLGTEAKASSAASGSRLTVLLELKHVNGQTADLTLDLVQDVYLRTSENREISPVGIISRTGDNEWLLKAATTTLSQNSVYWVQLVFEVPVDMSQAVLRLKEFPPVQLRF